MIVETRHDGRAIRVLLYTLIPSERECEPIHRSPMALLRNRLRRCFDLIAWRLTGTWRAHYSTFENAANTNRGDIGIRVGARRQLERIFAGHTLAIDEVAWGELGPAIDRASAPYDLIVIAGGGYLFADREGRLPPRFHDDIAALERTSAPVVAISVGLNHLIMPDGSTARAQFRFNTDQYDAVRRFLSRVNLVSVRDDATRRALAAIDANAPRVIIDPAFLLVSTFDVDRRRHRTRAPEPNHPLAVGINVAFHGTHAGTINRRLLTETVRALQAFSAITPCRFYYFIHSDSEHGIVDAMRLRGLSIDVVEGDVDTMLTAYKRLDMHIGQMLHSAIFAMSVGVPTLGVAYDTKSAAFFSLFGLSHLCLDATTVDRKSLLAAVQKLAVERERTAATIAARGSALRTDAAGFYKELRELVLSSEASDEWYGRINRFPGSSA
jgi:polysaccharide pyruvyl transferase WcaK-like protein